MNVRELLKRYAAGERDFRCVDLSAKKRRGARLVDADLSGADLSRANLSRTNLSGANLSGANLIGADLSAANLNRTYLIKANLSKANLSGADCSSAELLKANLQSANLENVNLENANLENANLSEANLTNAKLMRANLENASFLKAILNGVLFWDGYDESLFNFWRYKASFAHSHCLSSKGIDLREASFNEDTKFPPDFNPLTKGACFVGLTTCFFETALLMDISDHPFLLMTEDDLAPILDSEVNEKIEILDIVSNSIEKEEKFNPEIVEDSREKIQRAIVQRRGQPQFRQELLKAYNNKCAITGFDAEQSLEAAHIYPYKGDDTNKVENGLLLRADIHTLFDLYLIAVEPETKVVIIAPELVKTKYKRLNRKKINLPRNLRQHPSEGALIWHYNQCDWINKSKELEIDFQENL